MIDMRNLTIDEVKALMRDKRINIADLKQFINTIILTNNNSEELSSFLKEATKYLEENREVINKDVPPQVNQNIDNKDELTPINPTIENVAQPVNPNPPMKEPIIVETIKQDQKQHNQEQIERLANSTVKYCEQSNMKIEDINLSGENGHGPYITFEINNESKAYLDNLMLTFSKGHDDVHLDFFKSKVSQAELFTIEVDQNNLSPDQLYEKMTQTLETINDTVKNTRPDYDYEQYLSPGLKDVKNHFTNDDPDIPNDITVGYVHSNGKDNYYIIGDEQACAEFARKSGYEIQKREGTNVFEVETYGAVNDTKLSNSASEILPDQEVPNLFQYNGSDLSNSPQTMMIENFLETSNDPHYMSQLEVIIPPDNPNQRIVKMRSSSGTNDFLVFDNGADFDRDVIPKIVSAYTTDDIGTEYNMDIVGDSKKKLTLENVSNTTLVFNGYPVESVEEIAQRVEEESKKNASELQVNRTYQKSLGTKEERKSAFVSISVLLIVFVLTILLVIMFIFLK